jgi:hypothetical protein
MPLQQYVVRKQDHLWQIWLGRELLSDRPTYVEALNLADALAIEAVQRGRPSRVMIATNDGVAVEFPLRLHGRRPRPILA